MNTSEQDNLVQSMRDQGIADACAGRVPRAWFFEDELYVRDPNARDMGNSRLMARRLHHSLGVDSLEYRSAFAYAMAYEQNQLSAKEAE